MSNGDKFISYLLKIKPVWLILLDGEIKNTRTGILTNQLCKFYEDYILNVSKLFQDKLIDRQM